MSPGVQDAFRGLFLPCVVRFEQAMEPLITLHDEVVILRPPGIFSKTKKPNRFITLLDIEKCSPGLLIKMWLIRFLYAEVNPSTINGDVLYFKQ